MKKQINETVSDIVYHLSMIRFAHTIIELNTFYLTPVSKSAYERVMNAKNTKYPFYLSVARTKTSSFIKQTRLPYVLFTLDGRKLSHNFKAVPTDYYQNKGDVIAPFEAEDRIYGKKPEIKDFKKYIIKMDILLPKPDEYFDEIYNEYIQIKDIILWAKKNNIPLDLYLDRKDLLSNKNNISISEFKNILKELFDGIDKRKIKKPYKGKKQDILNFTKSLTYMLLNKKSNFNNKIYYVNDLYSKMAEKTIDSLGSFLMSQLYETMHTYRYSVKGTKEFNILVLFFKTLAKFKITIFDENSIKKLINILEDNGWIEDEEPNIIIHDKLNKGQK